jgi:hypothetical protein
LFNVPTTPSINAWSIVLSIHMYKAHREEYMKDMDRKWKEGAAERQRLWEEMKKRPKIVIPQVNYTPDDENWDDCDENNVFENK